MSLFVHHAPHLGPLGDALASLLGRPLPDPFEAEVVAVPTAGLRDWVQRRLALTLGATGHADGVTANVDLVFPGRFVARALGRPADEVDPWAVERLTWAVLTVLDSGAVEVPGRRRAPYALARRIADLFDRYAVNRPEILQQWATERDGDGTVDVNGAVSPLPSEQLWQPRLWRAVREVVGIDSTAEHLPDLLADLRAGRLEPELPERVALFGVSSVAPGQLQVLLALAEVREVHLHLIHPSPVAWRRSPFSLDAALTPRAAVDAVAAVEHPLLRSWGRPAMEAAALLRGRSIQVVEHASVRVPPKPAVQVAATSAGQLQLELDAPSDEPTLLQHVQATLESDEAPARSDSTRRDATMLFHACHGATRQLEVLRDSLGHLFAADPTLQPQDVLVLCPDLQRFVPLVPAVFGRGSFPVPVRVTDLSLGSQNAVAGALLAALNLVAGRATAGDVLALCGFDPVRVRFGIGNDDIERFDRWTADLGTTWGFDAGHRGDWLSLDIADGTWAATLDRVLLGAAMPSPVPRLGTAGVVPYDDVDAQGLASAGRLADVLARLRAARAATSGAKTIDDWCDVLVAITQSLFATRPADEWQMVQVLDEIDRVRESSAVQDARSDVRLSLTDVRAMLDGLLDAPHGRLDLRSGAVTFTAMVPVRNLPARVIAIVGLEEGTLRAARTDGDDILGVRACVGERDARAEGRSLLLDALLSAEDHLLVTFDGNDITTNRRLPLPVQLGELLETVGHRAGTADLVTRHPRRAHDESNFLAVDGAGSFSFDGCMLEGAEARRHRREDAVVVPHVLDVTVPLTVRLEELADACTRPARTYLRDRLDVRLPRDRENIDPSIPLSVTPLDVYTLGDDLLRRHHELGGAAAESWRETTRLQGGLPPRELARAALGEVEEEVEEMLAAMPDLREIFCSATGTVPIDISLDTSPWAAGHGATVSLRDTVDSVAGDTLVRVAFTRPKARTRITSALTLAALVVASPDRAWNALLAMRGERAGNPPVVLRLLPLVPVGGVDAAMEFLRTALDLRLRALREPLPIFEASKTLFDTGTIDDPDIERDMRDDTNVFLWAGMSSDDLLAIAPVHSDPFPDVVATGASQPSRMAGYARAVWQAYRDFALECEVPS